MYLAKFLDDCNDAEFLKFVNNAKNEKFRKALDNEKSNRIKRKAFDAFAIGVAIIAIPETFGGSIPAALAVGGGGVAFANNAIQDHKSNLSVEELLKQKNYLDAWDYAYATYGVVEGIVNLPTLVKAVNTGATKLVDATSFGFTHRKGLMRLYRMQAKKLPTAVFNILKEAKGLKGAGNWATAFPKLASKTSTWSHLDLVFEGVDDYVRVLSKNGDEVAKVFKNGTDEVFEISDDFFRATPSNPPTSITGLTVKANTGETIIGGGFFKNADGSIGFVEDVNSYGSTIVQNAIKARGDLRATINGITKSQDAHHLFPVDLLKKNQWVKKGVEGGFEFNVGNVNGMPVEKYVKATGVGRHGPHPQLTSQIDKHMEWWAEQTVNGVKNSTLSPAQTADYMRGLANSLKNKINNSTIKLNDLNLNLPH